MKKFLSLIAAVAAVTVLSGASLAQAPKAAAPATPAAAPTKAPMLKNITGEFVMMDKAAKTATVKYLVDQKPTQIILTVDEAMLTTLTQFKAGDQVKVSYEETDGKFIAKTIVKA
jgi:hypothetical protein